MDSVRPAFDATRDSARTMLLKVLDPAQQADFRKMIETRRATDSTRRSRENSR
jgi:hypothetical protein